MKIKKGDNIIVLSGKDKGKKAKVLRAFPSLDLVLVEGVNVSKKHQGKRRENEKGQVISKPMPVNVSNVLLFCQKCGRGRRLGTKNVGDKKVRVCVNCKSEI